MKFKHWGANGARAWLLLFTMLFAATAAWAHGVSEAYTHCPTATERCQFHENTDGRKDCSWQ